MKHFIPRVVIPCAAIACLVIGLAVVAGHDYAQAHQVQSCPNPNTPATTPVIPWKWKIERYDRNGAVIETFTGCTEIKRHHGMWSQSGYRGAIVTDPRGLYLVEFESDGQRVEIWSVHGFCIKQEK